LTKGIADILLVPTTSTPEQKTTETVLHHPARLTNQKKSSSDDAIEAKGITDGTRQSRNATEVHALSSAKSASTNAKGPLGTHQSMIIGGKAIALKASKDSAISAAKIASPLKTIEKGADHPTGSKKQEKSPTNDVVETKGIGDSFSVPTTSTKSKKAITAPKGPIVTQHSGEIGGKAIALNANAEKIHDECEDNPNRIEHVPGENH
jgi:hypothetical protein